MHRTRYIAALALIAFTSLVVGVAGCGEEACHEDEGCGSGGAGQSSSSTGQGGTGGGAADAGAD